MAIVGKKRKILSLIKSAIIIDKDEHFREMLGEYCLELGIREISSFEACDAAWTHYQKIGCDLIILDWHGQGAIDAKSIFNRVKNSNSTVLTPILVTSGLANKQDFRLLNEFPCSGFVEKPFSVGPVSDEIIRIREERYWFSENVKKINQLVNSNHSHKDVKKFASTVLRNAPNPGPLAVMYAKILQQKQSFQEAEELLKLALSTNPNHVALLSEIGKLYHVQGKSKEALKILERAERLSPDNPKRLCLLGEVALENQEYDIAKDSFHSAKELDPFYERARLGGQLVESVEEYFTQSAKEKSGSNSFASLMNSIGISKVKLGKLDHGVHHYESALKFIKDYRTQSKVMFNIGLGYLRHGHTKDSLLWFMRSSRTGRGSYQKANDYVAKLIDEFVLTDEDIPDELKAQFSGQCETGEAVMELNDENEDLGYDDFDDDIDEIGVDDDFDVDFDDDVLGEMGEESIV